MCFWCGTGRKNINRSGFKGSFVKYDDFVKAIRYMQINNIIGDESYIVMYIWGEPFLHPQLKKIIKFLNSECIKFCLSTNASKFVQFEGADTFKNLGNLIVSMPGFSQKSYDRIHKFNFERIKKNILLIKNNFSDCGFKSRLAIAFHVYQFNIGEITQAIKFAEDNHMRINASAAFFNDYGMYRRYLTSEMNSSEFKRASQDLLLGYINKARLSEMPSNFRCPQYDYLTIDDECNVTTCCTLSRGDECYSLGNLFNLSLEKINELKTSQRICKNCLKTGIAYLQHNPEVFYRTLTLTERVKLKVKKRVSTYKPANIIYDRCKKNSKILGMF